MKQIKKSKDLQPTTYKLKSYKLEGGYITLLSTLFLVAIGGVVAGSLLLLGLGSGRTSLVLYQSNQAKALANACTEEAIQKLRESIYYAGSETLTLTTGSCQIQAVAGTGNSNRTVQTTASVGTIQRKIKVVITTVNPAIVISSWQEVADFD